MTLHQDYGALVRGQSPVLDRISCAFRGVERMVRRAITAADRRYRTDHAVRMLSRLDDHILTDIGVARGSIRSAARQMAERGGRGRR